MQSAKTVRRQPCLEGCRRKDFFFKKKLVCRQPAVGEFFLKKKKICLPTAGLAGLSAKKLFKKKRKFVCRQPAGPSCRRIFF
jgi:hypothetical protein